MQSFNETRPNRDTANVVVINGKHLEDEVHSKIISSYDLPRGNIKEFYMCHRIEEISNDTFDDQYSLTRIELSPNLLIIGDNAFQGCGSLYAINIPKNVEKIGRDAFADCSYYLEINFANFEALQTIGASIFGETDDSCVSLGFTSTKEAPNKFPQWNCYTRYVEKVEILSTGHPITLELEYQPGKLLAVKDDTYGEEPMDRFEAVEPYINLPTSNYDTLDIVISLSTLDGNIYEVTDFFKQKNSLFKLAGEQHPELNDIKNPWSFVIPGVETPVKNLTCLQLLMMDIDEKIELKDPILIVWDDVDA